MGSDAMDSGTPPKALSLEHMNDTEASSQWDLGQGGGEKTVKVVQGGQTLAAGHTGEKAPMDTDGGGYLEFGPQPDAIRRPIRLQNLAGGLPRLEGVRLFHRQPLSNQRCRILYQRC